MASNSFDNFIKREQEKQEKRDYEFQKQVEEIQARSAKNLTREFFYKCANKRKSGHLTETGAHIQLACILNKQFEELTNEEKCIVLAYAHPQVIIRLYDNWVPKWNKEYGDTFGWTEENGWA